MLPGRTSIVVLPALNFQLIMMILIEGCRANSRCQQTPTPTTLNPKHSTTSPETHVLCLWLGFSNAVVRISPPFQNGGYQARRAIHCRITQEGPPSFIALGDAVLGCQGFCKVLVQLNPWVALDILGIYGDNGKENGNYYTVIGYTGILLATLQRSKTQRLQTRDKVHVNRILRRPRETKVLTNRQPQGP